jgi:hypothetical protein
MRKDEDFAMSSGKRKTCRYLSVLSSIGKVCEPDVGDVPSVSVDRGAAPHFRQSLSADHGNTPGDLLNDIHIDQ